MDTTPDTLEPTYEDLDCTDQSNCTHRYTLWISKGRRELVQGEVDDNITCLNICLDCGAVVETE